MSHFVILKKMYLSIFTDASFTMLAHGRKSPVGPFVCVTWRYFTIYPLSQISRLRFHKLMISFLFLFRMRRRRDSSVFQSLRSTGPANAARSSKCMTKAAYCTFMCGSSCMCGVDALAYKCSAAEITPSVSPSCLCSAFKACHPKVKSFYFAADGVDDMNR